MKKIFSTIKNLLPGNKEQKLRFKPHSYNELMSNKPESPDWFVDKLFHKGTVNMLAGESGIGKSWMTYHLAQCITSGNKFLGEYEVARKGRVLIIDEENAIQEIHRRLKWLADGMALNEPNLPIDILDNRGIWFDQPKDYERLGKVIADIRPDFVIVDSLVRIHSADENSSNEMNKVFQLVKRLKQDHDLTFLITHHFNKYNPRSSGNWGDRLRGSSDIKAFVDSLFTIGRRSKKVVFSHNKARWGAILPSREFKLNIDDKAMLASLSCGKVIEENVEKEPSKSILAQYAILDMLANYGVCSRKKINDYIETFQIKEGTADIVRRSLVKDKTIICKGGHGNKTTCWLNINEDSGIEASSTFVSGESEEK